METQNMQRPEWYLKILRENAGKTVLIDYVGGLRSDLLSYRKGFDDTWREVVEEKMHESCVNYSRPVRLPSDFYSGQRLGIRQIDDLFADHQYDFCRKPEGYFVFSRIETMLPENSDFGNRILRGDESISPTIFYFGQSVSKELINNDPDYERFGPYSGCYRPSKRDLLERYEHLRKHPSEGRMIRDRKGHYETLPRGIILLPLI